MNIDIVQALGPIRHVESDANKALLNLRQAPLDINNQMAFFDAVARKKLAGSAVMNQIDIIHNCRHNIISSF